MTTLLIEQSGQSFEQLCGKADALRDDIRRTIVEIEAEIDAASPGAEDHRRRLRHIAMTLDDVSTVKLIGLALHNDETAGATLDMIYFALMPGVVEHVADAAALVAMYDEDVAALERNLLH